MIPLNLQMFGGGGSSSGGKKSTGATNAVSSSAPGRHGSAGRSKMDYAGVHESKEGNKVRYGSAVSSINEKQSYILFDNRGNPKVAQSGEKLLQRIRRGELRYDRNLEKWIAKSGNKYIIRVRR